MIGAEVLTRGTSLPINPRGSHATDTFTALLLKDQEQDEMVANGSQAGICMIAKYMDSPQILQQCKHKVMLEEIVVSSCLCKKVCKPEV